MSLTTTVQPAGRRRTSFDTLPANHPEAIAGTPFPGQQTADQGIVVELRFTVDTLEARVAFLPATECSLEGIAWLTRESHTLMACAVSN